jgi:hypothetical protein
MRLKEKRLELLSANRQFLKNHIVCLKFPPRTQRKETHWSADS